jgi:hypothetical protein
VCCASQRLTRLAGDAFARPIAFNTRSDFITATAVGRHMSGVAFAGRAWHEP